MALPLALGWRGRLGICQEHACAPRPILQQGGAKAHAASKQRAAALRRRPLRRVLLRARRQLLSLQSRLSRGGLTRLPLAAMLLLLGLPQQRPLPCIGHLLLPSSLLWRGSSRHRAARPLSGPGRCPASNLMVAEGRAYTAVYLHI